jgi:2-dehydro-3-deoxygluconokinase
MQRNTLKIACIGEAMIEMITNPEASSAQLGVAGDSMNTAIYLKRSLPAEHQVSFVSMVGQDSLSDRIVNFIAAEGVNTDLLKRHPTKLPGLYSISTNDAGERSFSYWRNASAARSMFSSSHGLNLAELDGFDFVFASAISLAILPQTDLDKFFQWIAEFRSKGGRFIFDSNYRPALWSSAQVARREIEKAWRCCDIALPSIDDEMELFGDANEEAVLARMTQYGIKCGVMKRSDRGPVDLSDQHMNLPNYPKAKTVIDTTAAGDSFNGGFLATFLTTNDAESAAKHGHDLACRVVAHRGAIIPK